MGDETQIHYDMPDSKRQNMKWKHNNSLSAGKFNEMLILQKSMVSVFWDSQGVILVDYMQRATTINSEQ